MLKRILTAVVALAIFIPILLFAPYWAVAAVFGLLAAIAVFEIAGCVGLRREWWLTVATMLLCAVYIVVPAVCDYFRLTVAYTSDVSPELFMNVRFITLEGCRVLLVLLYVLAAVLRHSKLPTDRLMLQFGMTVYVALGFDALRQLAAMTPADAAQRLVQTSLWLWVALCIPWIADTLAYFTGYLFGKRKLCPEISPKKTVAGAVGGVVGTGAVALVVFGCVEGWGVPPVVLIGVPLAAMLLAVVSIFGDLFASVLKRQFGVKDYGSLFPGHGGIMDRFDSTLPVAMVLLLLVNLSTVIR